MSALYIILGISLFLFIILQVLLKYEKQLHGFNEDGTYGRGHHDHSWHW